MIIVILIVLSEITKGIMQKMIDKNVHFMILDELRDLL